MRRIGVEQDADNYIKEGNERQAGDGIFQTVEIAIEQIEGNSYFFIATTHNIKRQNLGRRKGLERPGFSQAMLISYQIGV